IAATSDFQVKVVLIIISSLTIPYPTIKTDISIKPWLAMKVEVDRFIPLLYMVIILHITCTETVPTIIIPSLVLIDRQAFIGIEHLDDLQWRTIGPSSTCTS